MNKKFNKGITPLIAIIIIAAVVIIGAGAVYYYYVTLKPQPMSQAQQNQIDKTADWKLFVDNEVGYSLKYPPELKVKQASVNKLKENITRIILPMVSAAGLPPNTWGFKSDYLVFDIEREKLEDISDEAFFHSGYPGLTTREDILGDKQALENGKFGRSPGFSLKESQKVVKLDNTMYGKEFMILGEFDVCSVLSTRALIFFKNGYKVSVVLQAWAVNKIMSELPQYSKIDQENCGNSPIWNNRLQFYNDLVSGAISPETEAGIWYNTFDQILATIKFTK